MNIIIGGICLWLAWTHVQDAIEPNRLDRTKVRWNSATLAVLTAFLGLLFLGVVGPGPA